VEVACTHVKESGVAMKTAYLIGGLVCLVCLAIGIYYLVPGPTHLLVSSAPTARHLKHAAVFFVLAVLSLVGARFAANAGAARS
jgi:hypothetical protein